MILGCLELNSGNPAAIPRQPTSRNNMKQPTVKIPLTMLVSWQYSDMSIWFLITPSVLCLCLIWKPSTFHYFPILSLNVWNIGHFSSPIQIARAQTDSVFGAAKGNSKWFSCGLWGLESWYFFMVSQQFALSMCFRLKACPGLDANRHQSTRFHFSARLVFWRLCLWTLLYFCTMFLGAIHYKLRGCVILE